MQTVNSSAIRKMLYKIEKNVSASPRKAPPTLLEERIIREASYRK